MLSVLRLINLALIALAVFAASKSSGAQDAAFEAGRWTGMGLMSLMPVLAFFGLARGASRGLRKTAVVFCFIFVAFLGLGALMAAMKSARALPALIGAGIFAVLCALNVWALRALMREEDAVDSDTDASLTGRRYWRGEYPLAITWWAGGGLVLLVQFMQMGIFGLLAETLSLRLGAAMVLSMFAISAALLAWHGMAVWRSATRQAQAGSALWPSMAKMAIAAAALAFGVLSATTLWVPLREHALIAMGLDHLDPVEASVTTDDTVLLLHGTFGAGSAERVRLVLNESPDIETVALSSPGGRLREAADIAQMVRERGLDTYVDTRCESACTFVFLAGKDRAATPNARIGFHRPSFAGITPMGFDPATDSMLGTYRDAGIPQDFLDRIARTEPKNMWYPSARELEKAGVINRVSLGGETSAIGYLAASTRQDMEKVFRTVPMMVALERHFPGTIDDAVKAAWMERTQGGVDSAVGNAARNVVGERYPALLAAADDDSLDEFAKIMVDQLGAAKGVSVEACRLLLAGQLNIAQVLSPDLVQREQAWALGVLQSEKLVERAPVDVDAYQRTMAEATAGLPAGALDVMAAPAEFANEPHRQCDATLALYESIMELPDAPRHLLLRGMFQAGAL
jgi:hypothetical protein